MRTETASLPSIAPGTSRSGIVIGSHEVSLLRNGRELFPAMLGAIAQAQRTVLLEMYWVENDVVGRAFREALAAAAQRGVDVRVIVDGFGSSGLRPKWFEPLVAAGGKVEIYRPLLLSLDPRKPRRLLARDHRKILVVDNVDGFVGGINLCVKWSPIAVGGQDWRDTAIHARGAELATHLACLFEVSWSHATHRPAPTNAPIAWSTEAGRLGVLANLPERRQGRKIRQAYLWGLRHAKKTIDITCAYFAPRPLFVRALVGAVRRGVRVRLLLPLASDVWIADLLAASWTRALTRAGIEVYGYAGSILHAKTAVVDARWVTVGSHNLDALSWAYNLECNIFADDTLLGAAATRLFEDDLVLAVRLPTTGSSWNMNALSRGLGRAMSLAYAFWL